MLKLAARNLRSVTGESTRSSGDGYFCGSAASCLTGSSMLQGLVTARKAARTALYGDAAIKGSIGEANKVDITP